MPTKTLIILSALALSVLHYLVTQGHWGAVSGSESLLLLRWITGLALSQQLPASFFWKWNHSQCPFPCPQQHASTYNSCPTRAHRPLGCQGKANFFVHRAATDGGTALPSVCAGCFLVQFQEISRTRVITVLSRGIKKIWPLIETCLLGMVCASRHHVDTLLPVVGMKSTFSAIFAVYSCRLSV